MSSRTAENYVDYQERAAQFAVGDMVVPFGRDASAAGRITAVWPAIGMIDVEYPTGNKREAVEEMQLLNSYRDAFPPVTNSAPGGQPTVSVPGGPAEPMSGEERAQIGGRESYKMASGSPRRVAEAFVRKALYWNAPDRQYRATSEEIESGHFKCPKCRGRGQDSTLRPAVYKRQEGKSEKLLGCPECLFLVKRSDIVGHPEYVDPGEAAKPFANRRVV